MEQLAHYIATGCIKQNELARRIGLHPSVVSRFLSGAARPSLDTAFAIERVTSGAVPASSWVSPTNDADAAPVEASHTSTPTEDAA